MTLSAGERFDRYLIEELLGEGGMARVYRAHDPRLHRRVALKVLRLDSDQEPESAANATNRVLREARAAAALDHPNAVSVFDVGEADGQLFIAMELVVGKSLRAYVNDVTVRWEVKLRWMVDAARALGAAHDKGLVHRDVKPENVMVRSDGVVKVLDFGIAKRLRVDVQPSAMLDDGRTQSVTQSIQGGLVGTPWYLSPEQLRGEAVDVRTDQFAWGVTTYELLTGQLPWPKGVDGFQLVLAILNKTPEAPSRLLPALPSIVDATIMKALAKLASQRFDSMESVAIALEGIATTSQRSWAEIHVGAMTKTDPAPPMTPPEPLPIPAVTDDPTTLPSKAPSRRARRRWPVVATGLVAAAGAGAIVAVVAGRGSPLPAPALAVPLGAVPAGSRAMPITDAPAPRSGVPEALAAYRSFQQNFRDADWNAALGALGKATERDPTLAAGHLRLAFMRSLESIDESQVRTTFMRAVRNRSTLDERDGALLEALAPYLQSDPSDPAESIRRLEALRSSRPNDAEIAYVLGSVRYDRGDLAAAVQAFDEALVIDPDFALAGSTKGGCLSYMGRFDEARASLEHALRGSRTATEPLWYLAELDEQQGTCEAEEAHVRTWLSRDPDDWYAYQYLARALAGEGKPPDAVRAALEQEWVRLEPGHRARLEPVDRALVALTTGDFAEAEQRLTEAEAAQAGEPGAQAHAEVHALLARIAEETGKPERARAVAEAYLARKDAWAPSHRVDNVSIFLDPVPEMIGLLSRTGGASPAQLEKRRGAWLDAWRAKTSAAYVGDLWLAAWAAPASTREQGLAAVAALGSFGGVPPFAPNIPAQALAGHAYLLADRVDDAVTALRRGTATCTLLFDPFASTRGWLDLGAALEAKGDRPGACEAYKVVADRWGHARPRSVTAEKARARSGALGCR
jgi:serine/threonine protein kinase/tetratricopeptide (TPR) repeat protein